MIFKAQAPIKISFVKCSQRTNFNGTISNQWSFSFPLHTIKQPNGDFKTFYQTAFFYDNSLNVKLQDKQVLFDCVWKITKYLDTKNNQQKIGWQLIKFANANENTKELETSNEGEFSF